MLGRITHRTTAATSLANLQANQLRQSKLQEQLTSGKSISKASDNPAAAAEALRHRSDIAANEQYARNITDGRMLLDVQEGVLDSALKGLQKVKALAVQGASTGNNDAAAREAIAKQVDAIREELLGAANTKHLGRAVFGGNADITAAYEADGTYNGNSASIKRSAAPGVDVDINIPGASAFGTGTTAAPPTAADNTFKALEDLSAALRSGTGATITASLGNVELGLDRITGALASIGARGNQLAALQDTTEARGDYLSNALEEVEGVDIAKAMVEFNLQNTAYQAALAATAKVIQPTLLDFLR
ncbi:flagellar hook-associated protein 3 FlgL [Kineococcus xinjiangensis]|uniref:Flagellar hook-associated protein 3 FlgL n=1 Tax=Kineococcus xinjiangensis TaxID=512762 RepID=A0A2S6ID94_9ACTN|nr:flagellar hook-associated protein FlgL [Kineococcus xinjiangensis]PPK92143.1 flagellar hook-associated protein 3 FlgL [Kineococcus xinjiangensis]